MAGSRVELVGAGFTERVVLQIEPVDGDAGQAIPVEIVEQTPNLLTATLPSIPAGDYVLVVTQGEEVVRRSISVGVPETPCSRGYQANTQLSVPSGQVVIERFYADGTRERVETPITDIAHLEYQVTELSDGRRCGAILLRKTDGDAVVFEDTVVSADQDAMPLRDRAETVARYLDRTLVVPDR